MNKRHRAIDKSSVLKFPDLQNTPVWVYPIAILGLGIALLLGSSLVPYQPINIESYRIEPEVACPRQPITAWVTREYLQSFHYLRLSESWVTVDGVEGFAPDRPVQTEAAELPPSTLRPAGRQTVPSPLLREAPLVPGTYAVRIIAEYHGSRFGFYPAIGSETFRSVNTLTVRECSPPPPPPAETDSEGNP